MDRSLTFYRDLLRMSVVLDTEMQGEMLEREVALDGAHLRLVHLRGDGSTFLELLEYFEPSPARQAAGVKPSDVGSHHVAFLVDDIHEVYSRLASEGVRFTWKPQQVDVGVFEGHWTAYCYDPDDLVVELWQLPAATKSGMSRRRTGAVLRSA